MSAKSVRPLTALSSKSTTTIAASAVSTMSSAEIRSIMNISRTKDMLDIGAQILVMALPILTVFLLAIIYVSHSLTQVKIIENLQIHVDRSEKVTKLIGMIEIERQMSCLSHTVFVNETDLPAEQATTDQQLFEFEEDWVLPLHDTITKSRALVANLSDAQFDNCAEIINSYHHVVESLISQLTHGASVGNIQSKIDFEMNGVTAWTYGIEATSVLRGFGRSYYMDGVLTFNDLQHLISLEGTIDALLVFAGFDADELVDYEQHMYNINPHVVIQYKEFRRSHNSMTKIKNVIGGSINQVVTEWLNTTLSYIRLLNILQTGLDQTMHGELDELITEAQTNLTSTLILVVSAFIFSIALAVCYFTYTHKIRVRMQNYAAKLTEKTNLLEDTEQKTHSLLCEMMPPAIVTKLRMGELILPELFKSATVMFCDIVDFELISSQSKPEQIVSLLNDVFQCYDTILAQHDCYKVETIGDELLVVSGVPHKNDDQHSYEIASLALKMIGEMSSFTIGHLNQRELVLRIGMHTGSVTSGVVGHRAPRYCLFGDAVNTASRMMSYGRPLSIHVSAACHKHITKHHIGFEFSHRERMTVKGKGKMITYWLQSMHGYHSDPQNQKTL